MLDIDFVEMLEWGMPPVSGYGQSERLFWFLEDITGREGTIFPQLRNEVDELTKKIYPDVYKKTVLTKPAVQKKVTQTSRIDRAIRNVAYDIVDTKIKNKNLVKHSLAVEAAMQALARHFGEDESIWGLAGLLHDADWEETGNHPHMHTRKTVEWMKEKSIQEPEVIQAILSHNFERNDERPPESRMEWALYICDELTGIIVATTLIMPSKKLSDVTVESVMKKFNTKSFAAAVNRDQIRLCEEKLGIKLNEFIKIILTAMQDIAPSIGL
jgi:hypothetical protein